MKESATGKSDAMPDYPVLRKPPPAGVIELVDAGFSSVLELKDGCILANNGMISRDGGATWSETSSPEEGVAGGTFVRLTSGAILHWDGRRSRVSRDESKTWSQPVEAVHDQWGGPSTYVPVVLSNGRVLVPCSLDFNPKFEEFLYDNVLARGTMKGRLVRVEGHQHLPELYMTFLVLSDDEGQSWTMEQDNNIKTYGAPDKGNHPQALWGWFDSEGVPNGNGGHWSFGEAAVAEGNDGSLLMFGRSEVGRIVYSRSHDLGLSWSALLPTELASSGSPPQLVRMPNSGDLLCVWNQVSREEIRRGYRRGRLSAAISRDSGYTWENFKTLELSDGLADVDHIGPEYPIRMVRARDDVGELPGIFLGCSYSNISFAGDKVFVSYGRGFYEPGEIGADTASPEYIQTKSQGAAVYRSAPVVRIYPLEYFRCQ